MRYRRKPCEGCAFRSNSPERQNEDWWNEIILSCCHKPFVCHKTCFQKEGDQWHGSFDPLRKVDGTPCDIGEHQLCAGFAKMFGEEIGIDPNTIEDIP